MEKAACYEAISQDVEACKQLLQNILPRQVMTIEDHVSSYR